jgi:hypothetical protein
MKDLYGQTPLFAAASRGREVCTNQLFAVSSIDVETKKKKKKKKIGNEGRTPLALAARRGM